MERPHEITPGIHGFATRTPTLPPATHTNSYALGERDVLLVEPASPYEDEQRAFVEWARGLEAAGRRLVAIFLTHHHPDHVGGAAFYARELGLPLWAHRATAERLPRVPMSRILEDGERLTLQGPAPQRWTALHTPGHAPGHLCLHEPDLGYVVAGDMVASEGTILIEPGDGDMQAYLAQLARLRDLDAKVVLPAHGAPIQEPRALFEHYIRHRNLREAKVVGALASFGPAGANIAELVPRAYDDTSKSVWPIAALSVAAHLVKLVREGTVSEADERYAVIEKASQ
jgi:glyoxylase-like metal-dependent hydrolase (beta-lactamase superfamily II)